MLGTTSIVSKKLLYFISLLLYFVICEIKNILTEARDKTIPSGSTKTRNGKTQVKYNYLKTVFKSNT